MGHCLELTVIFQSIYYSYRPLVRVGVYGSQVIRGIWARIYFTVGSRTPEPISYLFPQFLNIELY